MVLAGTVVALVASTPAQAQEVHPLPSSGNVTVSGHGNGHGHGMSQYGARGAAIAGLNATQIVQFYYPHTTLGHESPTTTVRVNLSKAGGYTCVQAKAGLTVTGVSGALPTSGINRYRLVPSGSGLALQRGAASTCGGSAWTTVKSGLAAQANFANSSGYVVSGVNDGTYTAYRGSVGAVRSGTGEITVNRVGLDQYTMGVAPRETPASWQAAAVQAQAIAARTYADYERQHAGSASYDICDSSNCQVYGGMTHYGSTGAVLWTDDPAAITGNSGVVLVYAGVAAFTQYSASDGGWTVSGGQPYLIAQADPHDNTASADPYLNWSRSVPVSSIASAFGLSRATQIEITSRDGHGAWGGRVLAGYVDGVDAHGTSHHIAVTGAQLQSAMGLMTNWFTL
jgi:peptidoglycan hydrolase-like amidase